MTLACTCEESGLFRRPALFQTLPLGDDLAEFFVHAEFVGAMYAAEHEIWARADVAVVFVGPPDDLGVV